MYRFFVEVAYDGSNYSGFQKQNNAVTIQSEIEKCLTVYYRRSFILTGASRTDAGVHAYQNFFHFDDGVYKVDDKDVYHLNRILPVDIVIKQIIRVEKNMHCRFDAIKRSYEYLISRQKNPFLLGRAFYFPYPLNMHKLNEACNILLTQTNFQSFSKRNSQVYTYECNLLSAEWTLEGDLLTFKIAGNRFLRGMVRGIVGTMLDVGKQKITLENFQNIIKGKDSSRTNFAVPPYGLYLKKVEYRHALTQSTNL